VCGIKSKKKKKLNFRIFLYIFKAAEMLMKTYRGGRIGETQLRVATQPKQPRASTYTFAFHTKTNRFVLWTEEVSLENQTLFDELPSRVLLNQPM
jgi:hypothetical protein